MGEKSKMDKWRSCDIIVSKYLTVFRIPQGKNLAESITNGYIDT